MVLTTIRLINLGHVKCLLSSRILLSSAAFHSRSQHFHRFKFRKNGCGGSKAPSVCFTVTPDITEASTTRKSSSFGNNDSESSQVGQVKDSSNVVATNNSENGDSTNSSDTLLSNEEEKREYCSSAGQHNQSSNENSDIQFNTEFTAENENDDLGSSQWQALSAEELLNNAKSTSAQDVTLEYPSDLTDNEEMFHNQSVHRYKHRLKVEPRDTSVILFPGQGSQYVGMGKALLQYPNVVEMYSMASEILQYDLLNLCLNGPKEDLDKTIYSQPAVLVTSLAAVEKLRHEMPHVVERCVATAGFSVGEIASLVFAGALNFEDAVNLINVRAKAMQRASEHTSGGMMTVFLRANSHLGHATKAATLYMKERLGIEEPICNVANFLFTNCRVIAGHTEGLDFIEKVHKEFNISRVRHLPVSGAFHTELMASAKVPLRNALSATPMKQPAIWCYSNVTGKRHPNNVGDIKKNLVRQLTKQVLWEQTMCRVYDRDQSEDYPQTFECGPGSQILTMLKLTNNKAFKEGRSVTV